MQPSPLPPPLDRSPFRTRDALDHGITPDRLRASDLSAPFRGVRVLGPPPHSRIGLARAFAARMHPEHVFSHVTAAELWEIPLALRHASDQTLDVLARAPRRAPQVAGIRARQASFEDADVRIQHGLRVSAPELTWCCLASVVSLLDLVAAGDYLITPTRERHALTHRDRLVSALADRPHLRGRRTALRALEFVREGALSRPESVLRVLAEAAGLPQAELNADVVDDRGRFVAMPDLTWPDYRVAVEYEGDYHRTARDQFHKDIQRIERLVDAGWLVVRVSARALFREPVETVELIARRLRSRGWRGRARVDMRLVGLIDR